MRSCSFRWTRTPAAWLAVAVAIALLMGAGTAHAGCLDELPLAQSGVWDLVRGCLGMIMRMPLFSIVVVLFGCLTTAVIR